jgi:uncharacterized membrane protein
MTKDEGVTWMLSKMSLLDLIDWTAADIQPPLYYLMIWSSDIFLDDHEWSLRFPSALFSLLTIPLIYVLALRLFMALPQRATAALLAAALFSISPLMVYYSQEARMYTLLVFEATLASYLLLRILHPAGRTSISARRSARPVLRDTGLPIIYAITAAAALYTHYFALFLLLAHALYALYILWQRRFNALLTWRLLIGFGGACLLFVPWLPTLLARLGDDPSYWPGALKVDEVLRKVIISFSAGETVIEQTGWWLTLGLLGLLALGIGLQLAPEPADQVGQTRTDSHDARQGQAPLYRIFLLLWLLLPMILILALTYRSPKFNPRYTLLTWPAFALALAAILTGLLNRRYAAGAFHFAARALFTIVLLLTLGLAAYSLFNWFADPRFSKDDFKALAQFVRERETSDETVLLSSGHLFPVWAYYYGWEGWQPLPWMLRLDVNRVTDLDIASDIAEAVAGQGGVWLVTWQNEVIDPNGLVPFWLDLVGQRPNDAGDFWGVGLEHWRLDGSKLDLLLEDPIHRPIVAERSTNDRPETQPASSPEDEPPAGINFADRVDLLGFTQLSDSDLALFWRARQPLPDNLIMTLTITDRDGLDWGRDSVVGRPGSYAYPPARWPVNQIVMTRHRLPWQTGTPPGLYGAEIGLGIIEESPGAVRVEAGSPVKEYTGWDVLDAQGRPKRRTALLDFVNLSRLVLPDSGPLPMAEDPVVDFFPIIGLRRSILPHSSAQPGDRILLALLWQAGEYNLDDVSLAFDLTDSSGQTYRVGSSLTPSRQFNLPRWKPGDVVLGQYWLDIPPEAAPGPASLRLHIVNVSGYSYDEVFPLADFVVLPTDRTFTPPDTVDVPLEADFSGQARLIGMDCPLDCRAAPGDVVSVTLYWQAEAPFDANYTIFTHVLDPAEAVLINADHAPPKPTLGWITGEIITDPVTLVIPEDLPAGSYPLEVGRRQLPA